MAAVTAPRHTPRMVRLQAPVMGPALAWHTGKGWATDRRDGYQRGPWRAYVLRFIYQAWTIDHVIEAWTLAALRQQLQQWGGCGRWGSRRAW